MRSHAEENNFPVIDWEKHLKSKKIDWDFSKKYANTWESCIIGQLSEMIERINDTHAPCDDELLDIGTKFNEAIQAEDAEIALIWLKRAKEREKELLSELLVNRKNEVKEITEYLKK
jgi:hypothetical protein